MKRYIWLVFFLIVIVASILRVWQLGNVPPSPDWDEVALGYNAYSILHTGRDEFGKFLPVVLRSFDDYKPALYAYLTIPSIFLFGLNVFAVRLPSAIFGIISVIAVFFLIRELFSTYKFRDYLAIISSFLLAISPWSIQFSRVAFEANVGLAINILMALAFLKGLKKPWFLIVSAILAGFAIYTYQSEKIFTPLLVLSLVLIYRRILFSLNKKFIITSVLLGIVVILPMILYIFGNNMALLRATATSIFSDQNELLKYDIQKLNRDIATKDTLGLVLDNRRVIYAQTIISGYISHFDFNWLFIQGDKIQRHHAPNMGLLYLFELPFILIGIYKLLFSNLDKKTKLTVFAWFLLAPIPASVTAGVPHAVRTLNFLPTWQIFSALGIIEVFTLISNFKFQILNFKVWKVLVICYLLFAIFNFTYYLNQYLVQQNYYNSSDWQYGYQQAVDQVSAIESKYKYVVVSNSLYMDQSYIFFLFYLKYPPEDYQKSLSNDSGRLLAHHAFGKYTFRLINWEKDSTVGSTLFVGAPKEIPDVLSVIKTIYNLDGTIALRVAGR